MPSSFRLRSECPCHKKGPKRVIVVIDHNNRRVACQVDQVAYTPNITWHFFDEIAYIVGRPPEFNEHGEVAP